MQNEAIRIQRNKQILDAAKEIYLEKGVYGTEMSAVAERAGVARGLVYYYFKDRTELFQTLYQGALDAAIRFVDLQLRTQEPPLIRLERYASYYFEQAAKDPKSVLFFKNLYQDIPLVFGERSSEVAEKFTSEIRQPLVDALRQGMEAGELRAVDPELAAQIFWGGVSGSLYVFMAHTANAEAIGALKKQALSLLFEGLLPSKRKKG